MGSLIQILLSQIPTPGARGIFAAGGNGTSNAIQYITIPTTGNATDFGDLSNSIYGPAGCASSVRGIFGGGQVTANTDTFINVIDYITIDTTGNATDFGDLLSSLSSLTACSSSTRGVFAGGVLFSAQNIIQYITIASTGNATDFGDLSNSVNDLAACASPTRGIFAGGVNSGTRYNVIDYVTIASAGNATDFGDLLAANETFAGCSSSTRGIFAGGQDGTAGGTNRIQYITIASTGNATDFGDLILPNLRFSGCSSEIRGVFGGGQYSGQIINLIQYITIASTGNATDFGDLVVGAFNGVNYRNAACSNGHGGLQ